MRFNEKFPLPIIQQLSLFCLLFIFLGFGAPDVCAVDRAKSLRVVFLSCGQGDAEVIHCPNGKIFVVDGGDDRDNAGLASVIPYLKKNGVKKIDGIFVSHPHRDHFGGLSDVIRAFDVGAVYYSLDAETFIANRMAELERSRIELTGLGFAPVINSKSNDTIQSAVKLVEASLPCGHGKEDLFPSSVSVDQVVAKIDHTLRESGEVLSKYKRFVEVIESKGIPRIKLDSGSTLEVDPLLKLEILGSHDGQGAAGPEGPVNYNNYSLVFRLSYNQIAYMFTGDAEFEEEERILKKYPTKLKSTVLKSGHHGSRTSSSVGFLDYVKPKYAVMSCGLNNSFKHPHPETLDNYDRLKVSHFRTDADGTIESITDGLTISFRDQSSPLEFVKAPHVEAKTDNSVTFSFETTKPSEANITALLTTKGSETRAKEETLTEYSDFKTLHYVTFSNLKPDTTYQFTFNVRSKSGASDQVQYQLKLTTKPGGNSHPVTISRFSTSASPFYSFLPLSLKTQLTLKQEELPAGYKLLLFHSSLAPENEIFHFAWGSERPLKKTLTYQWIPTWQGDISLFAALYQGNEIIEVKTLSIAVSPRVVLVDTGHGNIGYYQGKYTDFKLDMAETLGLEFHSIDSFTPEKLKSSFALFLFHPVNPVSLDEQKAIKDYVANGGALLLTCDADYMDRSRPAIANEVLAYIGSKIRFNDDQVIDDLSNAGYNWGVKVTEFPHLINSEVTALLCHSTCSLISPNSGPLEPDQTLRLTALCAPSAKNLNSDNLADGWIYPESDKPIPLDAVEVVGGGRIACFGATHLDRRHYSKSEVFQTSAYNRQVVKWLAASKLENNPRTLLALIRLKNQEIQEVAKGQLSRNPEEIFLERETLLARAGEFLRRGVDGDESLKLLQKECEAIVGEGNSPDRHLRTLKQFDQLQERR